MAQHRKILDSGCGSKLGPVVVSPEDQSHQEEIVDTHTALLVRRSSAVLVFHIIKAACFPSLHLQNIALCFSLIFSYFVSCMLRVCSFYVPFNLSGLFVPSQ